MRPAGDYKDRVAIYRRENTRDELGGERDEWVKVDECWAESEPTSGRRYTSFNAEHGIITRSFELRWRQTIILPAMRLVHDEMFFMITDVLPNRRDRSILIIATADMAN